MFSVLSSPSLQFWKEVNCFLLKHSTIFCINEKIKSTVNIQVATVCQHKYQRMCLVEE